MAAVLMSEDLEQNVAGELFRGYVANLNDKPRHTKKAEHEVELFETFCSGAFPSNTKLRNGLHERMMSVAIEYEESGFIAGFRYAVTALSGQEQPSSKILENPSIETEKSKHRAITKPKQEMCKVDEVGADCITTKQIADMFGTSNFKVVQRIESQILPTVDEETRKNFCKVKGVNVQRKPITIYKMNRIACQLYLKEMQRKRQYVKIVGGCAKLQELMDTVFPPEIKVVST